MEETVLRWDGAALASEPMPDGWEAALEAADEAGGAFGLSMVTARGDDAGVSVLALPGGLGFAVEMMDAKGRCRQVRCASEALAMDFFLRFGVPFAQALAAISRP